MSENALRSLISVSKALNLFFTATPNRDYPVHVETVVTSNEGQMSCLSRHKKIAALKKTAESKTKYACNSPCSQAVYATNAGAKMHIKAEAHTL